MTEHNYINYFLVITCYRYGCLKNLLCCWKNSFFMIFVCENVGFNVKSKRGTKKTDEINCSNMKFDKTSPENRLENYFCECI